MKITRLAAILLAAGLLASCMEKPKSVMADEPKFQLSANDVTVEAAITRWSKNADFGIKWNALYDMPLAHLAPERIAALNARLKDASTFQDAANAAIALVSEYEPNASPLSSCLSEEEKRITVHQMNQADCGEKKIGPREEPCKDSDFAVGMEFPDRSVFLINAPMKKTSKVGESNNANTTQTMERIAGINRALDAFKTNPGISMGELTNIAASDGVVTSIQHYCADDVVGDKTSFPREIGYIIRKESMPAVWEKTHPIETKPASKS